MFELLGYNAESHTIEFEGTIQRLYFIETQMRQTAAPPVCRELIRRSRSLPLAVRAKHLPQGDLGQAVGYALNPWDKIMVCLKSGVMALDNNAHLTTRPSPKRPP